MMPSVLRQSLLCLFILLFQEGFSQNEVRQSISLDHSWRTIANDNNRNAFNGFESASFNDKSWKKVDVPHNWDAYDGYRRMRHGNRHGYAWYRKSFSVKQARTGKRFFLFFEGVGSYATVWLNGKKAGTHAGGRTTFTLDVTHLIHTDNKPNLLAVRADHPSGIKDLPWVCGGCSDERGFSEGSQPMGIFRPVQLLVTNDVRIQPFGVHIWNDTTASSTSARLFVRNEIRNYSRQGKKISVINRLEDKSGKTVTETKTELQVRNETVNVNEDLHPVTNPKLWSVEDPYLYTLITEIRENGKIIDRLETPYGIRTISWPVGRNGNSKQFLLNGKPVFINGVAEYEHLIGNSHAFSSEQVRTRVMQIKSAGFNAFRDAHQPHNLRYGPNWDSLGILWWTQLAAHVWYDSPEFRNNFKTLLTEWVKERRNSPSVVLWGLQNESKLPEDFARECTELVRQLDPTTSSQRKVTTCNGGSGTDWDVPQNWTGTYGGDPATYAEDVQRQVLIGEYGAWRTLDLHTEGPFVQNGEYSEDRMTQLMEMKVRLADSVKDKTSGHFMWLLTSHDNPGRVQGGEGYRELDRIGPVNYKGLLTPWEEPLDVFYMYRSNFAPKEKEPMVYIVSHTWPDRWTTPGRKDGLVVYSNCDEVELFNDVNNVSLGKRKRGGVGTHFRWDDVNIQYNVLYAVGYVNGKAVATDHIVLKYLPQAPHFNEFYKDAKALTSPEKAYHYLYRVNCGGPDYRDENGNTWMADRQRNGDQYWGSSSWTEDFPGLPPYFASQRKTADPIRFTRDWELFQDFRYGREKLQYAFPVPDGEYLVELYFSEPWHGTGGGMDCSGWRLFDVAINNKVVLKDLDIWKEAGHDGALKKTVKAKITGGRLLVSFPRVASGQAIISAIAIASKNNSVKPAPASPSMIRQLKLIDQGSAGSWSINEWLEEGDQQYADDKASFLVLPPNLFGAAWLRMPKQAEAAGNVFAEFHVAEEADVFIGLEEGTGAKPQWLNEYENTKTTITNTAGQVYQVYRKRFSKGTKIQLCKAGNFLYTVAVTPVSKIEPAYDLKPVTSYKAVNARFSGPSIGKGTVDGKERIIFQGPSEKNLLEWDIAVGVADTYSLTITYNNPHSFVMKGRLDFFAADGTLMRTEAVEFTPTRPGKSNYINSSTGTMINAGNYKVRLSSPAAEKISVNALEVQ